MKQMLTAIIVDDDSRDRENLKILLQKYCPDITILGEAYDKSTIHKIISKSQPDILFLDVHLGNITCFEIMDELGWVEINFKIIFITASKEHAMYGYSYNAIDYILKPIHPQKLILAIEKVKLSNNTKFSNENIQNEFSKLYKTFVGLQKINIKDGNQTHLVKISDIIAFTGGKNYTTVSLTNKKQLVTTIKLKEFEHQLKNDNFIRTHRSHLINSQHVLTFSKINGYFLVLSNNIQVPISRKYRNQVIMKINVQEI